MPSKDYNAIIIGSGGEVADMGTSYVILAKCYS